jgi:putative addiction module component (TIGR02574 family)
MGTIDAASLLALPAQQRLELIEKLWESLHGQETEQPLPAWKLRALEYSRAQYLASPDTAQSWSQVQANARQRLHA